MFLRNKGRVLWGYRYAPRSWQTYLPAHAILNHVARWHIGQALSEYRFCVLGVSTQWEKTLPYFEISVFFLFPSEIYNRLFVSHCPVRLPKLIELSWEVQFKLLDVTHISIGSNGKICCDWRKIEICQSVLGNSTVIYVVTVHIVGDRQPFSSMNTLTYINFPDRKQLIDMS